MANDSLYTISKAAEYLSVSVSTLRNWDKDGKFKSLRTVGGQRRYRIQDLENFKKGRNIGEGLVLRIPKVSLSLPIVLTGLILVLLGLWISNYISSKETKALKPDEVNLTIVDKTPIIYALYPKSFQKEARNSLKDILGDSQVEIQSPNLKTIQKNEIYTQTISQPIMESNEQGIKNLPAEIATSIINLLRSEKNVDELIDSTEGEYILSLNNVGGRLKIPKGKTKVWVSFPVFKEKKDSAKLKKIPVVTVTPLTAALLGWYRVTGITGDGFYIEINRPMSGEIQFNWIAIGVE